MRLKKLLLMTLTGGCLLVSGITHALKPELVFTENKGQFTDDKKRSVDFVLFKSSNPHSDLWITEEGISYVFKQTHMTGRTSMSRALATAQPTKISVNWSRVDMELVGATISREKVIAEDRMPGELNYYLGKSVITGVNEYREITISNVYPNIDWVIRSGENGIKYDFIVHPGGDLSQVKLKYDRCNSRLDNNGALHIRTPVGGIVENAPEVFYEGTKQPVGSSFKLENNLLSFNVSNYDHSKTLIIDPLQHIWASYYGGADYENGYGLDVDASNNAFMAGTTYSMDFPTHDPGGVYFDGVIDGHTDSYVTKFDNNGTRLWGTYYGGTSDEETRSLHVDNIGNVWMVGSTFSTDMPVFAPLGAYIDSSYNGESTGDYSYWGDGFILKFTNSGSVVWGTYFGGDSTDVASSIKSDASGNIYICGITRSPDFPILALAGAYNDATYNGDLFDAYVLKFSNTGNQLWSTYYGGSGADFCEAIAARPTGEIFLAGETMSTDFPTLNLAGAYNQASLGAGPGAQNGYILNFTSTGAQNWATYYGDAYEIFFTLGLSNNTLAVAGLTGSMAYPTQDPGNGAYFQSAFGGNVDAVITEFDMTTRAVTWSTHFGGPAPEAAYGLDWDTFGNLIVVGEVDSAGFPLQAFTGGYNDPTFGDGGADGFIAGFDNDRSLFWSTYYHGDGYDFVNNIVFDSNNNLWIAGESGSTDSPVQNNAGAYNQATMNGITDAHIAKLGSISFVSVNELPGNTGMQVYPNPGNGQFTITANEVEGEAVLDILSADGRLISSQRVEASGKINVDISKEAKGIYFIRLHNGASSVCSRIVIQ